MDGLLNTASNVLNSSTVQTLYRYVALCMRSMSVYFCLSPSFCWLHFMRNKLHITKLETMCSVS